MKKLTFLLFLFLNIISANAEYIGLFIKFTIETYDGKYITAHKDQIHIDLDSINNTPYLISRLNIYSEEEPELFHFYLNRISYIYRNNNTSKQDTVYTLINKSKIPKKNIRKIQILEMIEHSYMINIENKLSLRDTVWMKRRPVKTVDGLGYLCEFQLFIHEKNPELDKLLNEIKIISNEAINGAGDDEEIYAIIKKIIKYKVIVISTCSC